MSELGRKLQLRDAAVHVVNRPPTFAPDFDLAPANAGAAALLVFVRNLGELAAHATAAVDAARAGRLVWIAYPKAGQLGTDLNRDILADEMRARGVRGVRQIAIDDVWSALRFRGG